MDKLKQSFNLNYIIMNEQDYWSAKSDLNRNHSDLLHQSRLNVCIQAEEMNLVSILKPKIFIDGDSWCVLYGENIQDGICGFGNTPTLAIYDFNKSWDRSLRKWGRPAPSYAESKRYAEHSA